VQSYFLSSNFRGERLHEYLGRKGARGVEHTYPQRARLLDSDYVLVSTLNGSGMDCADSMRTAAAGRIVATDDLILETSAKRVQTCCLTNGPTDLLDPQLVAKRKQMAMRPPTRTTVPHGFGARPVPLH